MSEVSQLANAAGGVASDSALLEHDAGKCPHCQKIKDEDIYALSRVVRFRKSQNVVLIFGDGGSLVRYVHPTEAITFLLCNGQRSIADIARITRPFVKLPDDQKATEIAKCRVKHILSASLILKGPMPKPPYWDAGAVVMPLSAYKFYFATDRCAVVEYNPRDFLPNGVSGMGIGRTKPIRESTPATLKWEFTSECSTDCRYCAVKRRPVKPLSWNRTQALLEEAFALNVYIIQFNGGGDALLYPHLREVFELTRQHKLLPVVLSTKSFVSKEKARMLDESKMVSILQISIDSTEPEVADFLVKSKDHCRRAFSSIENALEAGVAVNTRTVITPYNIFTLPRLCRELIQRGVKTIQFTPYMRSGFCHSDDLFVRPDAFAWFNGQLSRIREEFPEVDILIKNGEPVPEPRKEDRSPEAWERFIARDPCGAGRFEMTICPDGKVIPCEQMPETEQYFCGDLSYQSIEEVWNGERLREFTYGMPRERFKGRPCYDCEVRERCHNVQGICVRRLALYHGDVYQAPMECPRSELPFVRVT